MSSISGSGAPRIQILLFGISTSVPGCPGKVAGAHPRSWAWGPACPAGPAGLFSDALQGLPKGVSQCVGREDPERGMIRPEERFDGVDFPLGLRHTDSSDSVGQLAHDDLLHRLLVGVYEGVCRKGAEHRMVRPEECFD